jgi:hypothetical protein
MIITQNMASIKNMTRIYGNPNVLKSKCIGKISKDNNLCIIF